MAETRTPRPVPGTLGVRWTSADGETKVHPIITAPGGTDPLREARRLRQQLRDVQTGDGRIADAHLVIQTGADNDYGGWIAYTDQPAAGAAG